MSSTMPNMISNDFLTCKLCFKSYTDPRILPCLHSFCYQCLEDHLGKHSTSSVFACPVCKSRTMSNTSGAAKFKTNYFLASLKDTFPNVKELTPWCEFCAGEGKEKSATSRCLDCRQSLCDSCAAVHCRTKITQSHLVLTMYQLQSGKYDRDIRIRQPITCEVHVGKKIKLYCTKCEQLLCLTCKATEHDGHKCVDLFDIGSHDREFIRTLLEPAKYKIPQFERELEQVNQSETDVMVNREHLVDDLNARRDFLCKMIEDTCNSLKSEIDGVSVNHQKQMESKKESLHLDLMSLKTATEFAEKLMTHGRDAEVVSMKKPVQERLAWLKTIEPSETQFQDGFKFQMGSISHDDLQRAFGRLTRGAFPQPRAITPLPTIPLPQRFEPSPQSQYRPPREYMVSPAKERKEKETKKPTPAKRSKNGVHVIETANVYSEDSEEALRNRNRQSALKNTKTPPKSKRGNKKNAEHPKSAEKAHKGLPPIHVQQIQSQDSNHHLAKAQLIRSVPVRTSQDVKKSWPTDITVNSMGELFVVDSNNKKVKVFSKETFLKGEIGGTGRQKLVDPWAVAVLSDDSLVVTDRGSRNVKIYNRRGKFQHSFKGGLIDPHGVAVNSKDEIIVADWEKRLVYVFDRQGNLLNSVAGVDGSPIFQSPYYVTVTPTDDLVVSDYMGHCVKIFDPQGRALYQYGTRGGSEQQLKYPNGVCADTFGNLVVIDRGNNRIHLISQDGQFRCFLATMEDGVRDPTAVTVDREGHLAVTDSTGMIKMYRYFPLQ